MFAAGLIQAGFFLGSSMWPKADLASVVGIGVPLGPTIGPISVGLLG